MKMAFVVRFAISRIDHYIVIYRIYKYGPEYVRKIYYDQWLTSFNVNQF